ncbi:MAG: hypothetical protein ACI9JZ_000100 [Lentimonas sp.]|jgi:hypothetical protein
MSEDPCLSSADEAELVPPRSAPFTELKKGDTLP